MIKAILFDVDGVLVDSENYMNQAALELFDSFGVHADIEDFRSFVGGGEYSFVIGASKFYNFKLDDPQKAVDKLYQIYSRIVTEHKMGPNKGAIKFISMCRQAGLKMALGSSAQKTKVLINLGCMGLKEEDFDAVVDGTCVERLKPYPDIFASCAYRIGVRPEECLVFEDALNGLRSAKAAGCQGVGITGWFNEEELLLAGADIVYDDFSQIPEFDSIESFNKVFDSQMRQFYKKTVAGKLIDEAAAVLENAYVKYSNYRVGAAILTEKGNIFSGCNVENASYGGTICAERNAATTAVAVEGPDVRFKAVAISSEADEPAPPCAICRQFLCEFMGSDAQVWLYSTKSHVIRHYNFGSVMPLVFEF